MRVLVLTGAARDEWAATRFPAGWADRDIQLSVSTEIRMGTEEDADILVISPSVSEPLASARTFRRRKPSGQVMFVVPPDQLDRMRGLLPFSPEISEAWVVNEDTPVAEFRRLLREAGAAVQKRRAVKGLYSRINARISRTPEPAPEDQPANQEQQPALAEHYLTAILANAPDALVATSLDGSVVGWSDAAARLFGQAWDDVAGKDLTTLFLPEERSEVVSMLRQVGMGENLQPKELRIADHRTLEATAGPVLGGSGAVEGVSLVLRDITDRKRAERQLAESETRRRESEARFRQLADFSPAIVWFGNPDGTLSYLNNAWYEYTGLTEAESIPSGWTKALHPDDADDLLAAWQKARSEGTLYDLASRLRRHDGSYRWYQIRALPLRDTNGEIKGWLGNDTDIHDQKVAEEALRRLNDTLEQQVAERTQERDRIWNVSQDLLAVSDTSGTLLSVNPAWTAALGWTREELIGRTTQWLEHPEDQSRTRAEVLRVASGNRSLGFENRLRTKSGEYRTLSWAVVPVEGMFYCSGRDVTEQKAAAERLAKTEEALRQSQKMEAVGQLTGGIAHDFNNLLAGITGSLELLSARIAQGRHKEADRYINAAQGAAKRASALTHRLLAFSRRQTLAPKVTNINSLVAGMEELIRRTVGPSITIEVVGTAGLWSALVDPHQLENALLNLCINARDAMPEGGRITIETANKWLDERSARERDLPPGQYISLCVTDTGTGMTPEVIARAFDPFFTTKPIGQGTGLGLSMIYGFVRQSGGQVRIYSEVGQGTTMCLYLPRHHGEADATAGEMEHAAAPRAEQGETVLVVDDEPTVRMLVTEVLEDLGYNAIEAADGPAALKILQSDVRIDLLVTDVGLPGGINGRQVADAARVARPDLKVLFITGYAENAAVGHGHLEPGMHLLTKPFSMDALADRVRALIADR
jgi:PAS domain S-box-containing protein